MRRKLDAYYTPNFTSKALLRHVDISGRVLEPCCGENAVVDVLRASNRVSLPYFVEEGEVFTKTAAIEIATNDIDQTKQADSYLDATLGLVYEVNKPNWIVTNPPFNQAVDILKAAWEHSNASIALLLRLSFLEPVKARRDFLSRHPPDLLIVLPRISFTGDGKTDSCTCAWMIWYRGEEEKKQGIIVDSKKV